MKWYQTAGAVLMVVGALIVLAFVAQRAFAGEPPAPLPYPDGVPGQTESGSPATPPEPMPYPSRAKKDGHGWACTLSGAVVGAGVGAATAGITGALAGGAWTAGCELGSTPDNPPAVIDGLPRLKTNHCWYDLKWVHWIRWIHDHPGVTGEWLKAERAWWAKHPRWTQHHHRRPIRLHLCLV